MIQFLGIGAQKAGTTWLYEKLRIHPDIDFPAGKEVHFWNSNRQHGIEWYRSLFSSKEFDGKFCGEITPAYSILPCDSIRECYRNFPDLKLIYLLRNPIERAWSSARMALERAEMEMHEASDQWFIDHFNSQGSQKRGDYASCLQNWLQIYPQQQLFVGFFEELASTPEGLLRRCFQHIGVGEERYDWSVDLKKPVFGGHSAQVPMQLRTVLEEIYRPQIDSLEKYLGVGLSTWSSDG